MNNLKISSNQFKKLIVLYSIGSSILITPGGIIGEAKQTAWLSIIIGTIIGLLQVWLLIAVGNLFPNMNLVQCSEKILGKWVGKIISLGFIVISYLNAATLIWYVGNFFTTQIIPEMHIEAVNVFFTVVVIIGMYYGIEVMARASEIFFPIVVVAVAILVIFNIPNMKFENLQPIFESGIKPVLRGSIFFTNISHQPLIVFLMIFPSCINDNKEANKSFLKGTLIGGTIMLVTTITCVLVMGTDISALQVYPTYLLAKQIHLGNYVERVESIIAVTWFITIFFKTVFYFAGAVLGLTQVLELKDYKAITLPLGMILIVLSFIIYPNVVYEGIWDTTTWIPYALTYGLIHPLLLLLVAKFKRKILHKAC